MPHAIFQIDNFVQWIDVFKPDPLIKCLPLAGATIVFILTVEHLSHPLALPAGLVAVPLAFYGILLALGIPLTQVKCEWCDGVDGAGQC